MNLTMESAELVEVLLYVHKNRRLIRDGEPRTSTSTFTQLLSSERTHAGIQYFFVDVVAAVDSKSEKRQ